MKDRYRLESKEGNEKSSYRGYPDTKPSMTDLKYIMSTKEKKRNEEPKH